MRVRIDKDVARKVAASAKKNNRSHAREVSIALAMFYERQAMKEFLSTPEPKTTTMPSWQ